MDSHSSCNSQIDNFCQALTINVFFEEWRRRRRRLIDLLADGASKNGNIITQNELAVIQNWAVFPCRFNTTKMNPK